MGRAKRKRDERKHRDEGNGSGDEFLIDESVDESDGVSTRESARKKKKGKAKKTASKAKGFASEQTLKSTKFQETRRTAHISPCSCRRCDFLFVSD